MAQQAIFTNEGEALFAALMFNNTPSVRPSGLELLLFTNTNSVSEATTYAELTEPTGGSYARKQLADANWTLLNGVCSYASQTFVPIQTGYTGIIQGAAIVTKGASPKVLFIVTDPTTPTLAVSTPYIVIPSISLGLTTKGNVDFLLSILLKNEMSKRGTGLKCVLFTNIANNTAKLASELAQPSTVGGYLAKDILDSDWSVDTTSGDCAVTCSAITFTPATAVFSADIAGYAIVTNGAGYIVSIELDPAQPVAIPLNTPYIITPLVTIR